MTFDFLYKALEGWFDKPLAALPAPLRSRVKSDFHVTWDHLTPDERRSHASQLDYQRDPESDHQPYFDLYSKAAGIREEIRDLEVKAKETPLEQESFKRQIAVLKGDLARVNEDLDSVSPRSGRASNASVLAGKIVQHFTVKSESTTNERWWRQRMRDAKRYGLEECRRGKGRPGEKDSSLWYPALIAAWLVEKKHMTAKRVVAVLRSHFPECADAADRLDPG